jgi:hypothetical protein
MLNRFIWLTVRPHDRLLWTRWINFHFPKNSTPFFSILVLNNFLQTQLLQMACGSSRKHSGAWFWHSCVGSDLVWTSLVRYNNYDGQISAFQSSRNESTVRSHLIPSAGSWQAWLRYSGNGDGFIITGYVVSLSSNTKDLNIKMGQLIN